MRWFAGDSPSDNQWSDALDKFLAKGASDATSQQDQLGYTGVPASEKMAETDLSRNQALVASFNKAGQEFDIPPAVIAALASRESRAGNILDSEGYGDNGNAYGILQVDKRYHTLQGLSDPTSEEHIRQAVGIVSEYRDQVSQAHPSWSDSQVLKGAAAAYNSGVGNVRTIAGMDIGTTGNDYSSDVVARAQYYKGQGF